MDLEKKPDFSEDWKRDPLNNRELIRV